MSKLDISKLGTTITEASFNDLLAEKWGENDMPDEVVCTAAQKRIISGWAGPVPLKRTLLDKLLFRTRFSDASLKASNYKNIQTVTLYDSDFGAMKVTRK